MTNCEQYQELISRMLDDDLSKAERGALAAHVKTCPDCAAVYVAFRSVSEHLGAELEEVPDALHENIMAEVRRDSIRSRNSVQRSHRSWHTVLTLAACLVLVVAAAYSLPKIVGRKAAVNAAPSLAMESVRAEEPMAAPAPAPEEPAEAQGNLFLGDAWKSPDSVAEEAAEEEVAAAEAPHVPQYNDEGVLILDDEQSSALLDSLSGEAEALEGPPDREIRVILKKDGEDKPLTILFRSEEAFYVRAGGDTTCRIDLSAEELLSLLGLADADK